MFGENVGSRVFYDGATLSIMMSKQHSRPGAIDRVEERAKMGLSDIAIELMMPSFDQNAAYIALLTAAYMAIFYVFGYEYLAWGTASDIQRTIFNAIERHKISTERDYPIVNIPNPVGFKVPVAAAVGVITFPGNLRCLGVTLPTPTSSLASRCVLLPGFGAQGSSDFSAIKLLPKARLDLHVRWRSSETPMPMRDINHRGRMLFDLWQGGSIDAGAGADAVT